MTRTDGIDFVGTNKKWCKLLLILVFPLVLAGCQDDEPDEEPGIDKVKYGNLTGKLVFQRFIDIGLFEFVLVDFDRKTTTYLSPKDRSIFLNGSLSVSPGGDKMAYSAYSYDYNGIQVFTMSSKGGDYFQLTKHQNSSTYNTLPVWNRDGTKLYYVYSDTAVSRNGYSVYSISSNGENNRLVADLDVQTNVSVSKDETYLLMGDVVFNKDSLKGIFTYHLQGKSLKRLSTSGKDHYTYNPVFSPDEKKIAFVVRRSPDEAGSGPYYFKINTMNADGSGQRTLITLPAEFYYGDVSVNWSPDGSKLTFNGSKEGGDPLHDIFVINLDGTGLTQISFASQFESTPCWFK